MRRLLLLLALFGCAPKKTPNETKTAEWCDPATMTIETGPLPPPSGVGESAAVRTGRFALTVDGSCHLLTLPVFGPNGEQVPTAAKGDFQRSYGLVRFPLAAITTIGQTDSAFADSTIDAAYLVHARAGGYFLDVHLARPGKASAKPEPGAAGVSLRLAVGGGAIPTLAPRARNVVVLEPRDGGVTYPIVVKGYARTFEANVQAWIEQHDVVLKETKTHATATDWMSAWGEFEITIPSGPSGDIVLFVGEESAKDGTPIGVRIPLRAK